MDEFEKSVGQSRLVKELMRRQNRENAQDGRKLNHNKYLTSFRSSKKKGAALFKNIKVAASSKSLLHKEHEHSSSEEQSTNKPPSQWVKARQHGKSYKEFTALHLSQEIQAHEGSIWVIRFSSDARFLASAGEDKVIHVWEVQECEISSTRPIDDLNSASSTPVHPMASIVSDRPERQVVDWTDAREMVTAASYTPGFHPQLQAKKITGFQFAPWNPSEVLITSTDSRIRIYNGEELIQKFRGFRNTSSQIAASFSPDGKHVISASEDSQVYIWKVAESKNPGVGKKSKNTVQAYEHFQCKDLTVAIAWPGSMTNEPPVVEIHSKRHSKRSASLPNANSNSPTHEDNVVGASKRRNLPPLPKKNVSSEGIANCEDDDVAHSPPIDPGIGVSNSSGPCSASVSNHESSSASAASPSPSLCSRSYSHNGGGHGGHTVQATAWGMVIITASLEGEIRVHQNFGLPRKVRFRD